MDTGGVSTVDRLIAITGLFIGIAGIAIGIYVSKPHNYQTILIMSGWVAALIIILGFSITTIIVIGRLQRDFKAIIEQLQCELKESKNCQLDMKDDLVQSHNLNQALAAIINQNPPSRGRRKTSTHVPR